MRRRSQRPFSPPSYSLTPSELIHCWQVFASSSTCRDPLVLLVVDAVSPSLCDSRHAVLFRSWRRQQLYYLAVACVINQLNSSLCLPARFLSAAPTLVSYMSLSIQGFTLMLLLVCMDDPDETIGFVLGLGKLDVKFLDSMFEMCDFVV